MSEPLSLPDSAGLWIEESKPGDVFLIKPAGLRGDCVEARSMYGSCLLLTGRWLPVELPTFPPRVKAHLRLCWATYVPRGNSPRSRFMLAHCFDSDRYFGQNHSIFAPSELTDIVWLSAEFADEYPHK